MPPKVLLNAMHTVTGGGLTYLQGVLPELAKDDRFRLILLVPKATLRHLEVPENVMVKTCPHLSFWRGHGWEQLVLPVLARLWGVKATLCNANYVPLWAPRPLPIIHTTPRASRQAKTLKMRLYWAVLRVLTRLSLYRAPVAFSVAKHVVKDYTKSLRVAAKVRAAPPAAEVPPAAAPVQRDPNLVITIGDYYPQKDYVTLLKVFKVLLSQRPQTRLLLVGRAVDGTVAREIKQTIAELDLARSVTLAGAVPHDLLMQALRQASVYLSTSKAECFNLPVLEAMACGVPCVLPDVDFQVEVADKAAVYVPVDKGGDVTSAYAVALFGVLENASIHDMLARAGLERAARFSWQATASTLAAGLVRALKIG